VQHRQTLNKLALKEQTNLQYVTPLHYDFLTISVKFYILAKTMPNIFSNVAHYQESPQNNRTNNVPRKPCNIGDFQASICSGCPDACHQLEVVELDRYLELRLLLQTMEHTIEIIQVTHYDL